MSFTTDATPNASIPPSEMPDATNPNPPKKDSTLKTVLIVLAVIFGIQFLLPLIFLVFIFAAVGPNIEEFFDDFTDEFSYEYDGGYSDYGGVWKIADTEQCLMLGSDNEFSWRQVCDDDSDNYLSGNYTVKSGEEAVDDINLTTAEIADLIKVDDYMDINVNRLYSFHLFARSEMLNGEENVVAGEEQHLIFYSEGSAASLYNLDDGVFYQLDYYIPATNYEEDEEDIPDPSNYLHGEQNEGANHT